MMNLVIPEGLKRRNSFNIGAKQPAHPSGVSLFALMYWIPNHSHSTPLNKPHFFRILSRCTFGFCLWMVLTIKTRKISIASVAAYRRRRRYRFELQAWVSWVPCRRSGGRFSPSGKFSTGTYQKSHKGTKPLQEKNDL